MSLNQPQKSRRINGAFQKFNLIIVYMHRVTQRVFIPHLRLASKVKGEPLKSDFTIDLKHEVSATVATGRFRVFSSQKAEARVVTGPNAHAEREA